jgi:hypothetical protein
MPAHQPTSHLVSALGWLHCCAASWGCAPPPSMAAAAAPHTQPAPVLLTWLPLLDSAPRLVGPPQAHGCSLRYTVGGASRPWRHRKGRWCQRGLGWGCHSWQTGCRKCRVTPPRHPTCGVTRNSKQIHFVRAHSACGCGMLVVAAGQAGCALLTEDTYNVSTISDISGLCHSPEVPHVHVN